MKVILVSGLAGSGKDYVSNVLCEVLRSKGKKGFVVHNADYAKEACEKYFNVTNYKTPVGRQVIMGVTDLLYSLDIFFFEKVTEKNIEADWKSAEDFIIVADWRYPNTYNYFTIKYGTENVYPMVVQGKEADTDPETCQREEHLISVLYDIVKEDGVLHKVDNKAKDGTVNIAIKQLAELILEDTPKPQEVKYEVELKMKGFDVTLRTELNQDPESFMQDLETLDRIMIPAKDGSVFICKTEDIIGCVFNEVTSYDTDR